MIKFLYRLLTGEYFNLYVGGGGGGQQQQPTTQTVQQTNLPAWAQPYSEQLLGKAQALTDIDQNKYQSYTGDRLAGFTPMQQQAFQNIGGMQVSPQTGQATGLAGLAGMGSMGAGANYMNMATNPAAIQAFMSPYQQNVTDWQKQQAIMDYGRQLPGLGARAAQSGAFGGSRQALVESEAQRNLQNQLAGIQAQGSQNAFNAAQQAQQFGAGLNLQGYGQATNAAQALNQAAQQQYQQQMGINAAQQQAGAQQQAMQQQQLTNQYQDFLNRQNYPYQQLAFMSDILHGTPTGGITTRQEYQAPPSMFNQIAGLGLGAYGLSNLFGKKEGGEIKGYKEGGAVKHFVVGGITGGMSLEKQYQLAKTMPPEALKAIVQGKPSEISASVAAAALPLAIQSRTAAQGMEAQQELAANKGKSVIDRMMETQGNTPVPLEQGLASLNADGVGDVDKLAEGGVIGYADGGDVKHFQLGGLNMSLANPQQPIVAPAPEVAESTMGRWWRNIPMNRAFAAMQTPEAQEDAKRLAELTQEREQTIISPWQAVTPTERREREARLVQIDAERAALGQKRAARALKEVGTSTAPQSSNLFPAQQMSVDPYNVNKFLTNAPPRAATPKSGLELLNAPPDQLAQIQAGIDARRALSPAPAAQAPTGIANVAPQAAEGRLSFADELKRASSAAEAAGDYAKPEMKAIEDLVSKRRQTSEADAEKRRSTALGLGALFAASELMQSGRTSTSSLGEAMKAVGKQGMEFTKEEQRIKDKLDEGDLSLAQAKLAFKKGNYESGLKLLESHDKRALEAAKIAGDQAYQNAMTDARNRGLSLEESRFAAENARDTAMQPFKIDLLKAQAVHARATGAAAGTKGGITPAVYAQIVDRASDNASRRTNKPSQMAQLRNDPRFKGMADEEIRHAVYREELTKAMSGIGALTPSFVNPAFGEGAPPEGAVIRPLTPAKP